MEEGGGETVPAAAGRAQEDEKEVCPFDSSVVNADDHLDHEESASSARATPPRDSDHDEDHYIEDMSGDAFLLPPAGGDVEQAGGIVSESQQADVSGVSDYAGDCVVGDAIISGPQEVDGDNEGDVAESFHHDDPSAVDDSEDASGSASFESISLF